MADKRARRKWDPEVRLRAKYLVVQEKYELADAAHATGVPLGTVKRWAGIEGWVKARDTRDTYADTVQELKVAALEKAVREVTSENVNTWATIERTYPERHYGSKELQRETAIRMMEQFSEHLQRSDASEEFLDELQRHTLHFFQTLGES